MQRIVEAIRSGNLGPARDDVRLLVDEAPVDFAGLHLAGVFALHETDLERAFMLFSRAWETAPDPACRAFAAAGLSETLLAGGDAVAAEHHARDALTQEGLNPEWRKLLARCLLDQGRAGDAVAYLEESLPALSAPAQSALRLQIAGILMLTGRADEALLIVEGVARMVPRDTDILLKKARLLEVLGRSGEAAEHYRRALEINPSLAVHGALVQCLGARGQEERVRLERMLEQTPAGETALRIDLDFALAILWDAAGDPDNAFRRLQEGNALKRANLHYQEADEATRYKLITASLSRDVFTRFKSAAHGVQPTPIFVVGMPRSGTSLAEQILGAHSMVAAAGELPFLGSLWRALEAKWPSLPASTENAAGEIAKDLATAAERYRSLIRERSGGRAFVTDKMPLNFRLLGFIRLLFPDARIIHCRRDPLDTCLSCYQQLFDAANLPFTYDLRELGSFYRIYRDYMAHWHKVLPSPPHELHYETLVKDMEGETRKVLDYCGLPFEPGCLDFHKAERTVLTASTGQVRKPVYGSSVGKWRRYEKHLGPLIASLGDLS